MRSAGILLPISALPNGEGIGTLGEEAFKFIDFLKASSQKYWQMLPIGPTSYGDSPYQSPSVFAGNPYFISLQALVDDGLLSPEDMSIFDFHKSKKIDYHFMFNTKLILLEKAYQQHAIYQKEFDQFCLENTDWLEDYALFMALKKFHQHQAFNTWHDQYKYRDPKALATFQQEYATLIDVYRFMQFLFFKQFALVKEYATENGIQLIGDLPIYCAYDSCDVWSKPQYFEVDEHYELIHVAGCPPDAFTEDGQLWGNPLYRYDVMALDHYAWWVKRIRQMEKLFDVIRIDHFRGFAGYYSIPAGAINAKNGEWIPGPKEALFKEIQKTCKANIIAENLGFLTEDVQELLDVLQYPGMHIFQFELGDASVCPLKEGFEENSVIYTGTHDNQTILSFYRDLNAKQKALIDSLCSISILDKPNFKMIEYCMKSDPIYCIIPMQDYLSCCDCEGRMNIPSTSLGNWTWRVKEEDFTMELASYISKITRESKRSN